MTGDSKGEVADGRTIYARNHDGIEKRYRKSTGNHFRSKRDQDIWKIDPFDHLYYGYCDHT